MYLWELTMLGDTTSSNIQTHGYVDFLLENFSAKRIGNVVIKTMYMF